MQNKSPRHLIPFPPSHSKIQGKRLYEDHSSPPSSPPRPHVPLQSPLSAWIMSNKLRPKRPINNLYRKLIVMTSARSQKARGPVSASSYMHVSLVMQRCCIYMSSVSYQRTVYCTKREREKMGERNKTVLALSIFTGMQLSICFVFCCGERGKFGAIYDWFVRWSRWTHERIINVSRSCKMIWESRCDEIYGLLPLRNDLGLCSY